MTAKDRDRGKLRTGMGKTTGEDTTTEADSVEAGIVLEGSRSARRGNEGSGRCGHHT